MNQPFVIEFVGMNGVGKTTITKLVIQKLNSLGYKCPSLQTTGRWMANSGFNAYPIEFCSKLEQFIYYSKWSYLIAALRFPKIAFNAYRFALSISPQNQESWPLARAPMNWKWILNQYVKRFPCQAVVLEDGGIQHISSISLPGEKYSSQLQKKLISSFLARENYFVVFIQSDVETVLERINSRALEVHAKGMQSWAYEHETKDFQICKVTQGIHIFELVAEQLRELIPGSLLEISSSNSAEHNAERVVSFIEQFLNEKRLSKSQSSAKSWSDWRYPSLQVRSHPPTTSPIGGKGDLH